MAFDRRLDTVLAAEVCKLSEVGAAAVKQGRKSGNDEDLCNEVGADEAQGSEVDSLRGW